MRRYKHSKTRQTAYLKRWTKKSLSRKSLKNYFEQMEKEYQEHLTIQREAMRIARAIPNPLMQYLAGDIL